MVLIISRQPPIGLNKLYLNMGHRYDMAHVMYKKDEINTHFFQ
jgi:hypothetical protein